jgi:hypothetical protein
MIRTAILLTVISAGILMAAGDANGQCLMGVGYNGANCGHTGSVTGGLPGSTGSTGNRTGNPTNNNTGTIARGGTINPGGGTAKATGVADLVFQSNGTFYGTAYAYNGSHFELYTSDGSVLKTFYNGCRATTPSNGVPGVQCSFGQWNSNGQQLYSGWALIYQNGVVYLRWMYSSKSNFKYVDSDSGWVGLRPRS